jgi:hypothetical protein
MLDLLALDELVGVYRIEPVSCAKKAAAFFLGWQSQLDKEA